MDYKSNSHKSKTEQNEVVEKKVEKVISGNAKTKKNDIRKFTELFISEDVENVRSYLLFDVFIPTIKDAIIDIVRMTLFGSSGNGGSGRRPGEKIPYRSFYEKRDTHTSAPRARVGYSYEDVVVSTRADAEEVLYHMNVILDEYKIVSVADLYELVGIDGRFTDNNYGWTDLRNASIERVHDGYLIRMPRVTALK